VFRSSKSYFLILHLDCVRKPFDFSSPLLMIVRSLPVSLSLTWWAGFTAGLVSEIPSLLPFFHRARWSAPRAF